MARLVLKRGAEQRVNAGHPWIYRTQVADLKGFSEAGLAVEVVDAGGRYLGQGFYNPRPSLCCRLLTRRDEAIDAEFFVHRLEAAWEYRRTTGLISDAYRLCWSEADGLPGLVVDRYGPVSVVQCLTLGMFKASGWITAALGRLFPGGSIHRLDDTTAARLEGFDARQDPAGPELVVTEGNCRFGVTPGSGHKTGLYLDQAENRVFVAQHAAGRRVLDAFCFSGAFACHALRSGATEALLLDSSADVLALARRNLEMNGEAGRALLREGNAFDLLRGLDQRQMAQSGQDGERGIREPRGKRAGHGGRRADVLLAGQHQGRAANAFDGRDNLGVRGGEDAVTREIGRAVVGA